MDKCGVTGCDQFAVYGYDSIAISCVLHRNASMRIIKPPIGSLKSLEELGLLCANKQCFNTPAFSSAADSTGARCYLHRIPSMIKQKKCTTVNCKNTPLFGYTDEPIKCGTHRMYNHKLCKVDKTMCSYRSDCTLHASHVDLEGKKYCYRHVPENSFCFMKGECAAINCNKIAAFAFSDAKFPLYCSEHKIEGMNAFSSETCISTLCHYPSTYGPPDGQAMFCGKHKIDGTIKLRRNRRSTSRCSLCRKKAVLFFGGMRYCADHKI